jgi:hypothetical protein
MAEQRRSFSTGAKEAEVSRSGGSNFLPYFSLKDGEQIFEQFVTPSHEWISVGVHAAVPTKARPADYKGNWPASMSAVCPNWAMPDGLPIREGGCYVCDHIVPIDEKKYKAKKRTFGLGLRRVEIIGDGTDALGGAAKKGKRFGFGVETMEVPKRDEKGQIIEGAKEAVPRIEVFPGMGWQNFWQKVYAAETAYGGVITNQIFVIKRVGTGLDTDYQPTPIKEVNHDLSDPEVAIKYGIVIDADGNKTYPPQIDLYEYVMNQASEEYFNRFFVAAAGPTVTGTRPDGDTPTPQMDVLQARLRAAAAPAAPAAAPSAAPAAGVDLDIDEE